MTTLQNSKITCDQDRFYVPMWIMDDIESFYPDILNYVINENNINIQFSLFYYHTFMQLRKQMYWLCHW